MQLPSVGDLSFESITRENIDLFACDAALEKFFKEDALDTEQELIAKTYFVKKRDLNEPVVAFCLSNAQITATTEIDMVVVATAQYRVYPAVLIGRFATHEKHLGKGFGTTTLDIIKNWLITDNRTGCRFLLVDARPDAIPFYRKSGFEKYPEQRPNSQTVLMYFDLLGYLAALRQALDS